MRAIKISLTLSLLFSMAAKAGADAGTPIPESMGALGDSISSAAFSNFSLLEGKLPWMQASFFQELIDFVLSKRNPDVIERKQYSWSTGMDFFHDVKSHARRISELRKDYEGDSHIEVGNFAVIGDRAHEMRYDQFPKLTKWSGDKLSQDAPDYVTILIGANDICSTNSPEITPTGEFIADVSYVVDEILKRSPRTRILVSSLPQMDKLHDTLFDQTLTGGVFAKTCGAYWKVSKECPRVTTSDDPQTRADVEAHLKEYREALAQMVQTRAETFGDRIRYSTAVGEVPLAPGEVSMDCFHPNRKGHNLLASRTWSDTWWADLSSKH